MQRTNTYVGTGNLEVFEKMQEIRIRRGYSKELMVWEIVVDLDKRLTDAEATIRKMERLP